MVGLHHLWPIAIADLALLDYEDAPWSHHIRVAPVTVGGSVLLPKDSLGQYTVLRAHTQFFDSLGSMAELKEMQQIVTVRNSSEPCLKLAAQTPRQCKLAYKYLI